MNKQLFFYTVISFLFAMSISHARLPSQQDIPATTAEPSLEASLTSCAKTLSVNHGITKKMAKGVCRTLMSAAEDQGLSLEQEVSSRHGRCIAGKRAGGLDRYTAGIECSHLRRASVTPQEDEAQSAELQTVFDEGGSSI